MIYTVTLNPALDYVLKTDALCFDNVNRAQAKPFALKLASACANASAYSEELATLSEIEKTLKK
ncbi:MAG: hypothetical protein IKR97_04605 [Eubacterium sp.]|nr:hypothetical protein [Eubacterium sp.]